MKFLVRGTLKSYAKIITRKEVVPKEYDEPDTEHNEGKKIRT